MKIPLREVFSALAPTSSVGLAESYLDYGYYDPDMDLSATQGGAYYYRRLTQAESDLAPIVQERMQQLALYLYDKNGLAKRCLELIRDFVVGEGFTVSSKDDAVQAVLDQFWNVNDMEERVSKFTLELGMFGEQVLACFVHEGSGNVRVVSIDPRSIVSVITDPKNPDQNLALKVAGPTKADARFLKIVSKNADGQLVGAEPGEALKLGDETHEYYNPPDLNETGTRLVGCMYWPINGVQGSTRGRSDLLAVADFLDLYDRMLFDEAERVSFLRAFVWDVTIKGASQEELQRRAAIEPVPKPGSVKMHNENEVWAASSPDLKGQDSSTAADLLLSYIATGLGVPKVWVNGTMDVNRATAASMDEPSLKRMRARQQVVLSALRQLIQFVVDQASIAGALPTFPDDEAAPFTVGAPEMTTKDTSRGAQSLSTAVQALGMADAANWVDSQTVREVLVLLLSQLGLTITTSELNDRLDAEQKAKDDADDFEIPGYFGVGSQMGSDQLNKEIRNGGGTAPVESGQGGGDGRAAPPVTDPKTATDMVTKLGDMLIQLGAAGVLDSTTAQEILQQLFAPLGIEFDPELVQQRLEDEKVEAEAEASASPDGDTEMGGADMPDSVDEMLDLDAMALDEVWRLGDGDLSSGLELLAEALSQELGEAFSPELHPRGPGGKFAKKADSAKAQPEDGGGEDTSVDAGDIGDADLEAQALELARELIKKQREKQKKREAAPKKPRKPAKPTMNKSELEDAIDGLPKGADVTLTLSNGIEVTGQVEIKTGGVAMLKTADGKYTALHSGLKGLSSMTVGDQKIEPGPREPRQPRAPRAETSEKPKRKPRAKKTEEEA